MRVALRGDELLVVRRPLQRAHLLRARATLTVGVTRATPDTHPAHCSAHTCPRDRVAGYGCRRARSAWLQARVGCRRARLRLRATVAGYGRRPRLHACERVSTALRQTPEFEFQKRMVRSAVPPPEARRLRCHGHQAIALTAAWAG